MEASKSSDSQEFLGRIENGVWKLDLDALEKFSKQVRKVYVSDEKMESALEFNEDDQKFSLPDKDLVTPAIRKLRSSKIVENFFNPPTPDGKGRPSNALDYLLIIDTGYLSYPKTGKMAKFLMSETLKAVDKSVIGQKKENKSWVLDVHFHVKIKDRNNQDRYKLLSRHQMVLIVLEQLTEFMSKNPIIQKAYNELRRPDLVEYDAKHPAVSLLRDGKMEKEDKPEFLYEAAMSGIDHLLKFIFWNTGVTIHLIFTGLQLVHGEGGHLEDTVTFILDISRLKDSSLGVQSAALNEPKRTFRCIICGNEILHTAIMSRLQEEKKKVYKDTESMAKDGWAGRFSSLQMWKWDQTKRCYEKKKLKSEARNTKPSQAS